MASAKQLKRLQTLIWVLIFGGLLGVVYGLSLSRYEPQVGAVFITVGALLTGVGAVLVFVRARLGADEPPSKL